MLDNVNLQLNSYVLDILNILTKKSKGKIRYEYAIRDSAPLNCIEFAFFNWRKILN